MASEPMSDERIAEIRGMLDGFQYGTLTITSVTSDQAIEAYHAYHGARWAIQDLLAEVERMRAREAALVALVQQIRDAELLVDEDSDWVCCRWQEDCGWMPDDGEYEHAANCPILKARTLLAKAQFEQ